MADHPRTLIIGLDGVPIGMLADFAESGVMPKTGELIQQGLLKQMHSTIPEISSVAWSSMVTGANPGEHGTYGFTDLEPDSYRMRFPNFADLKAPAFWDQWQGPHIIVNVPSTYPVRAMNGVHISGFVSIDMERAVHPAELIPQLKEMDYRLDVNSDLAHKNMDLFLQDVDRTLAGRIKAGRLLWDYCDWRTFMFTFTGTDRLMHFLWDAYEQQGHKYSWLFRDHFKKIDKAIGEMVDKLSDGDLIVMLSDHGFERLDYDVFLNYALVQEGFLKFENPAEPKLPRIVPSSKAFVLDPARIYLNTKTRFPRGSVDPADADKILDELTALFTEMQIDGRNVIRDIYRKKDIYTGPCLDYAPDLILVGDDNFNLKASLKADKLADKAIFTGKHTQDTAFLLLHGLRDDSVVPDIPNVADIKAIIEEQRS